MTITSVGMRAVAMVAVAATSAYARGSVSPRGVDGRERIVAVCVHPGKELQTTYAAGALASKIFVTIGVRVVWHFGSPCPTSESTIQISFPKQIPETQSREALAYARPYEGTHIAVFYDRVKERVHPARVHQLLAYVMVHEITHILQGIDSHSADGIMKAHWGSEDYFEMGGKGLGFTSADIDSIYRGLDARRAREAGRR